MGEKSAKFRYISSNRYNMCLYFMHSCVYCRELLLFLFGHYAKYGESVGHKNILQMGGNPGKRVGGGRRPNWGFGPQMGDLKT